MKNKEKSLDFRKLIGTIAIMLSVFCAGFLVKMYIFPEKTEIEKVKTEKNIKEDGIRKSREEIEDTVQNKDTIADVDTSIRYIMPDEIKNKFDMKKFDKELRIYLEDNMLFTTDTRAECTDHTLSIDYRLKAYTFYLHLNDRAGTTVCCSVEEFGKGSWSFEHY